MRFWLGYAHNTCKYEHRQYKITYSWFDQDRRPLAHKTNQLICFKIAFAISVKPLPPREFATYPGLFLISAIKF